MEEADVRDFVVPQLTGEAADEWRAKVRRCEQANADYYNARKFCPKCRTRRYSTTLLGFVMHPDHIDTFRDTNDIRCDCGWVGIKHDLVESSR